MSATTPMRTRLSLVRRGFTLIEIITSLAILGIIGLAFVRLVVSQARFTEGQMALRNARSVSRNAMNIMLTDIRMVQDSGGLVSAARDSVTMRVPVAFGLLCKNEPGTTTISLLPVDSAMTALGVYAG
ncbi:MAG: type II secretion system protein, partial [Gemmatimonadaceae bacterium]